MPVIGVVIVFIIFMSFSVILSPILTPIFGEEGAAHVTLYLFIGLILLIIGFAVFYNPIMDTLGAIFDRKKRRRNNRRGERVD
jgi:uncharacterized membrane protein